MKCQHFTWDLIDVLAAMENPSEPEVDASDAPVMQSGQEEDLRKLPSLGTFMRTGAGINRIIIVAQYSGVRNLSIHRQLQRWESYSG